ncbi:hypothetical protein GT484_05195 [Coprobacillus sp. BIOML-A1]|nr:hypothetical protein [Coprobacillus sp. BIOML-A1]
MAYPYLALRPIRNELVSQQCWQVARIFSECSMLECNKDLELYYLDSFKIVHEK